jgi:hypothetical protein
LWLKNADLFKFKSDLLIDFATKTIPTGSPSFGVENPFTTFNFTTETLNLKYVNGYEPGVIFITFNIKFTVAGLNYNLLLFKNGLLILRIPSITSTTLSGYEIVSLSASNLDLAFEGDYTYKIESEQQLTFLDSKLEVEFKEFLDSGDKFYQTDYNQTVTQITSNIVSVAPYFPIMKIEDFFTGLLKTFNLVCYSEEKGVYILEQLETYYAQGNTLDITEYIITDTKSIDRIKPYNKVKFEHEKSQSLNNIKFAGDNGREYGDLSQGFEADGGEYNIKLPFETLLFSKLSGTLQAGYSIKTDLKAYIPKPVIIYDYGVLQTVPSFKLNGSSYSTYNAFGSETAIGLDDYSLNFGAEVSSLSGSIVFNSLYSQFYNAYLNNLYSEKSRIFKTSAILPISYLTSSSATCLKLNTKIIISGKKYVINSFSTNLITGVVELDLINDFRDITLPNALANYITTDNLEIITTEDLIPLTINT